MRRAAAAGAWRTEGQGALEAQGDTMRDVVGALAASGGLPTGPLRVAGPDGRAVDFIRIDADDAGQVVGEVARAATATRDELVDAIRRGLHWDARVFGTAFKDVASGHVLETRAPSPEGPEASHSRELRERVSDDVAWHMDAMGNVFALQSMGASLTGCTFEGEFGPIWSEDVERLIAETEAKLFESHAERAGPGRAFFVSPERHLGVRAVDPGAPLVIPAMRSPDASAKTLGVETIHAVPLHLGVPFPPHEGAGLDVFPDAPDATPSHGHRVRMFFGRF
ncbi:hypothetical protein [Rhodovibrio sodomensis]|nr:hypothetical protein [Rhodovibrio sodomensis]